VKRLLALVVLLPVLLTGCMLNLFNSKTKLTYNDSGLLYTKDVGKETASKVGDFLRDNGYFDGTAKTVEVAKPQDTYQVRLVLEDESAVDDEDIISDCGVLATKLSSEVLNDAPVEVHLCDQKMKTIKVVEQTFKVVRINSQSTVAYPDPITQEQAQQVGDYLLEYDFFDAQTERLVMVMYDSEQDMYYISLSVDDPEQVTDQGYVNLAAATCGVVSANVFNGGVVTMDLCDENLDTLRMVTADDLITEPEPEPEVVPDLFEMAFNDSMLRYSPNIPTDLAEKFGNYLISEAEMMVPGDGMELRLEQESDRYVFSFVAKEEAFDDESYHEVCMDFAQKLSTDIFEGVMVTICLCNDNWEPVVSLSN
jgi:hypothetical protein